MQTAHACGCNWDFRHTRVDPHYRIFRGAGPNPMGRNLGAHERRTDLLKRPAKGYTCNCRIGLAQCLAQNMAAANTTMSTAIHDIPMAWFSSSHKAT